MNRATIIQVLLVVSVAFNAFCLGGYLFTDHEALRRQQTEELVRQIAKELSLSAEQQQHLSEVRQQAYVRLEAIDTRSMTVRPRLIAILSASEFETPELQNALDELSQHRHRAVIATLAELHAFLKSLTPEQRQTFLKWTEEDEKLLGRLLANPGP